MKRRNIAILIACGAGVAALPLIAQQRTAGAPVARYDMRAGTINGMGGGMAQMNPMAMMGGGRGNTVQHELHLRLGTSNAPTSGGPKADHFMPPSAKLGRSVALTNPRGERTPDEMPDRPTARLLIYWGCGERAPAGQPIVIDFARLAAGQTPPGLWSTTVIRDWGPTIENSRTFGRWPSEDGKYVKADSSLPGAHRVAGNYTPEIAFTLTKDFMQPLNVRRSSQPSGATVLNWTGVADATGYLAFVSGGKEGPGGKMGDMVMWTSSATRQFGGGLSDWLTPAQVAGLVRDRTVMPPSATTCTVPAEVKRAAPDFLMGTLTAYGPMEDFAYPPRPANARTPWSPEWIARIRHKSSTSWMDMAGMEEMGAMEDEEQRQQPACKPSRGLGGLLGRSLGGGSGC